MLEPVESVAAVRRAVAVARSEGRTVGLVPTMGALHRGHLRLIERCRAEAGFVAVSIFVNPTQFAPGEDLGRYPRTLASDLDGCASAGADLVFAPTEAVIYPRGRDATFVEVPGLSHVLEGMTRPIHFRGVATVVLALLEIVRPDIACFGQKDYQQQLLIRRMVEDLHVPVEVITVPTVRESDGLAMSSRNVYLDPEQREAATGLYRALVEARTAAAGGERSVERIRQILRETVESNELARVDYAEVADPGTLEPLGGLEPGRPAIGLLAAWVGPTRLIDNALLFE